ncbi:hypothetical protein HY950_03840 [Candidatus Gottesmanbacteria bacterium]|nr:hypothetical protein [Candidatus Gottesmanbacteria bacterium]
MKTIIQVPVEKKLRDEAEAAAYDQGFSSLQDVLRLFMHKFANGGMSIMFADEEQLSPRAVHRYEKILKDMEAGKNTKRFTSVDDLMNDLNS